MGDGVRQPLGPARLVQFGGTRGEGGGHRQGDHRRREEEEREAPAEQGHTTTRPVAHHEHGDLHDEGRGDVHDRPPGRSPQPGERHVTIRRPGEQPQPGPLGRDHRNGREGDDREGGPACEDQELDDRQVEGRAAIASQPVEDEIGGDHHEVVDERSHRSGGEPATSRQRRRRNRTEPVPEQLGQEQHEHPGAEPPLVGGDRSVRLGDGEQLHREWGEHDTGEGDEAR